MYKPSFLAFALLLLLSVTDGYDVNRTMSVPMEFTPTSAVSLVHSSTGYLRMFYRGFRYQLVQADLAEDGDITNFVDLGGRLQSAPHALTEHHVVFASADLRVAMRAKQSSGAWSPPRYTGLKTHFQPRLSNTLQDPDLPAMKIEGDYCITVTGLNNRVQSQCWEGGKKKPVSRSKKISFGYNDELFERSFGNQLRVSDGLTAPHNRMTSSTCYTPFSEGGEFVFGRGSNGKMVTFSTWKFDGIPWGPAGEDDDWMTADPDCILSEFCVNVVYPRAEKFHWYQTCT